MVTPPPEVYTASGYTETDLVLFAIGMGVFLVHLIIRISNWEGDDNT